jgi:DNA-binding XRE family transcriptional regulator
MAQENNIELKKGKKVNSRKFPNLDGFTAKEMFAQWVAFPSLLRKFSEVQRDQLGLDATDIDSLLLLQTREEFAKAIGMSRRNLYNYENEEDFNGLVQKFKKRWGGKRTPNMILALYKEGVREGDAPRVKLWHQIFEDFTEKQETKHTVDLKEVKELTSLIKGFLKR